MNFRGNRSLLETVQLPRPAPAMLNSWPKPSALDVSMRDRRIAELERRVADLEATVRDLLARLGQNASNSSIPPSANPPQAPPPVRKKPTGRKPGRSARAHRSPAYAAAARASHRADRALPAPRFATPVQHDLPRRGRPPDDPEPRWHQVVELPEFPVAVTEYQAHGRTCPNCGHVTWAKIPEISAPTSVVRG